MTPETDLNYRKLPERYRGGMKRYIEQHLVPGGFLTAMLRCDLPDVMRSVDPDMVYELRNIYLWIYNEAPSVCWGSPEKVREWVKKEGSHEHRD